MVNVLILAIIAQGIWHAKESGAADDITYTTEDVTKKSEAKKQSRRNRVIAILLWFVALLMSQYAR